MKTLTEIIDQIPGEDGWWKSDAAKSYEDAAKILLEKGFTLEETEELLSDLYWSAADCFGG